MSMNDRDKSSVHIHYSPTARYSIGAKSIYWHDKEVLFNGVQLNSLVKRWNTRESQANFYIKTGVGVAHTDKGEFDSQTNLAGFSGIALDWEDRRFFTSYENSYMEAGSIDSYFSQSARVGIAPYIGDYGDLHTWLMLQVDHSPEDEHEVTVTPLVRFFKDVHLVEAGVSDNGGLLFNYVYRY